MLVLVDPYSQRVSPDKTVKCRAHARDSGESQFMSGFSLSFRTGLEPLSMLKYLLAWIPMVFIAIVNGVLREAWYGKQLGDLRAHQLSTLIGALLFGVYIGAVMRC